MGRILFRGYCLLCDMTIEEKVLREAPEISFDWVEQSMHTGICTFCKCKQENEGLEFLRKIF